MSNELYLSTEVANAAFPMNEPQLAAINPMIFKVLTPFHSSVVRHLIPGTYFLLWQNLPCTINERFRISDLILLNFE